MWLVPAHPRSPYSACRIEAASFRRIVAARPAISDQRNRCTLTVTVREVQRPLRGSSVVSLGGLFTVSEAFVERLEQFFGSFGDDRAGRKNCLRTSLHELIVVLRRHHAADHDHDVVAALLCKLG